MPIIVYAKHGTPYQVVAVPVMADALVRDYSKTLITESCENWTG